MRTETIQVVKLEPSEGMHLRSKLTGEVYESYIYLAKSLVPDDFIEITEEEYKVLETAENAAKDKVLKREQQPR